METDNNWVGYIKFSLFFCKNIVFIEGISVLMSNIIFIVLCIFVENRNIEG